MKTQRYNLLTTCIVTGLHPNEPQGAGTKWEPTNAIDVQEAEQLTELTYAERWDARKEDVVSKTWLQKQDEAKQAAAAEAAGDFEPGTGNNEVTGDDADLLLILGGNVEAVTGEIDGLDVDQLRRLYELESAGKNRKGVAEAINEAIELIESQGEHGEESEDDETEEDQE